MNLFFLTLLPFVVFSLPCNETYNVSTFGHRLAKFNLLNISLLDNYVFPPLRQALDSINSSPNWKGEVLSIAEYVLPYSFIILLLGPIFLFLFILWVSLEGCFKCSSSPHKKYWSWSLLFSRVCLVVGSFGIAMIAAFGIFNVGTFHGELLEPFVSVTMLAREDGFKLGSLWQTVQTMATKFSIAIPSDANRTVGNYVGQIESGTEEMDTFLSIGHVIGRYTNFLLSFAFALIVFLCVLSMIAAFTSIKKTEKKG